MFVDASAIVAILTDEPEAPDLIDRLEQSKAAITSPIALFEAALGLCRKRHSSFAEARADLADFLAIVGIEASPITVADADVALEAFSRYGKGTGHPAQLNLGDCFAYAAARNHGMPLLFKGNDFDKTDIQRI